MALWGKKPLSFFDFDRGTQQAVNQYAAMPPQPAQQRPNWGQGLSDIGTGLMAAQAAIDGDFGTSSQLAASIGAAQRQAAEEDSKANRERAEWLWRKKWERDNPGPVNNDTVNDYNFISQQLTPEDAKNYLRNRSDPIVNIPLPGGRTYIGPRSGMQTTLGDASGPSAPPAQAIEALRANPALRDQFEAKYGAGSSARYLGGGAGNGIGGFPSRYR